VSHLLANGVQVTCGRVEQANAVDVETEIWADG